MTSQGVDSASASAASVAVEQVVRTADTAPSTRSLPRPSLHVLLAVMGLVIAVPALVFTAYLILRFTDLQHRTATARLEDASRSISDSVDRQIAGMTTTLRVLASSPLLDRGDYEEFQQRTVAALRDTKANVLLVDRSMRQVLNTRVSYGTPLGRTSDPDTAQRVFETGEEAVSNVFYGRIAQERVIDVEVPVSRDGEVRYVLILTMSADDVGKVLDEQPLDPGWSVVLEDRKGEVIAESVRPAAQEQETAGLPPGGKRPAVTAPPRATDMLAIYTYRSPVTGWLTTTRVPSAIIQQELSRSWWLLMWGGIALVVLSIGLAYWFSRVLSRPILHLASQARALGRGEVANPIRSHIDELDAVSNALTQAARERAEAEARIRLLMRELSHRAKNQLALVNAIARQTGKRTGSVEEFQQRFGRRVEGMARSMDLFIAGGNEGVELADLVRTHLDIFDSRGLPRVDMSGPTVLLDADMVERLGLALHELATNASKYGALSVPEGRVVVRWAVRAGEGAPRLSISWREENGPPVSTPRRRGFGSQLIEHVAAQMLDATTTYEFERSGLRWSIDMRYPGLEDDPGERRAS